jgi:GNAT superfamily N-acetyltransferase
MNKWYKFISGEKSLLNEIRSEDLKKSKIYKYLEKRSSSKQFEELFQGKLRFAIPYQKGKGDFESDTDRTMLSYLAAISKELGWTVDLSQPFGYATKIVQSTVDGKVYNNKKRVKIGPLFKQLGPAAEKFWINNAKFYTTKENELYFSSEYQIVVSRVPIDILRMSDMDGWNSCHSVQGSYFRCAIQESVSGGAIAYIVSNADLKNINLESPEIFSDKDRGIPGIQPLSRIRIRRIINKKAEAELAIPETRTYGADFPGFYKTLAQHLYEQQKKTILNFVHKKEFDLDPWSLVGGTYEDTTISTLADRFMSIQQPYIAVSGDVRPSTGITLSKEEVVEDIEEIIEMRKVPGFLYNYKIVNKDDLEEYGTEIETLIDWEITAIVEVPNVPKEAAQKLSDPKLLKTIYEATIDSFSLSEYMSRQSRNKAKIEYDEEKGSLLFYYLLSSPFHVDLENFSYQLHGIKYWDDGHGKAEFIKRIGIQLRLYKVIPSLLEKIGNNFKNFVIDTPNHYTIVARNKNPVRFDPQYREIDNLSFMDKEFLERDNVDKNFFVEFADNMFTKEMYELLNAKLRGIYPIIVAAYCYPKLTSFGNQIDFLEPIEPEGNSEEKSIFVSLLSKTTFEIVSIPSLLANKTPAIRISFSIEWNDLNADKKINFQDFVELIKFCDNNMDKIKNLIYLNFRKVRFGIIESIKEEILEYIKNGYSSSIYPLTASPMQTRWPGDQYGYQGSKRNMYESKNLRGLLKEQSSKIKYKTNSLKFFLDSIKGIKQLRVPSWYLQSLYYKRFNEKTMAVVAFDGWTPVGIATLSETSDWVDGDYAGLVNLYIHPTHRGLGIASTMFKKIEKLAVNYEYIVAGRRTGEMFEKRNYQKIDGDPDEISGGTFYVNKYFTKSLP